MRVAIAVLAEAANVAQNGNLNVFGIFDQITAPAFPTIYRATIVIGLRFTRAEVGQNARVEVKLMDEDNVLFTIAGEFMVPPRPDKSSGDVGINQLFGLNQMPVPKPGSYSFRILVNGREEGEIPFTAVLSGPGTSG